MPERGLRQRIRQAIMKRWPHAIVLQFPANPWTGPGWPDLLVYCFPLTVALEVKQWRAKPTPAQQAKLAMFRSRRLYAGVVHTPEEALAFIHTALGGIHVTFDENLFAELDAALGETAPDVTAQPNPLTFPAPKPVEETVTIGDVEVQLPAADPTASLPTVQEAAEISEQWRDVQTNDPEVVAALDANKTPTVADALADVIEMSTDATHRLVEMLDTVVDALEAVGIELKLLREELQKDPENGLVIEEPIQTIEAPAPRRRRKAAAPQEMAG